MSVRSLFIRELEIVNEEALLLLERAAHVSNDYGWYPQAEKLYLRAFKAFSDVRPRDEPQQVRLIMEVARAQMKQSHYPMAALLYKRSYEDCERLFGRDHPTTLSCLNELALAQLKQGTFQLAMETAHVALERVRKEDLLVESAESAMTCQVAGEICQIVELDELAEGHYLTSLIIRRNVFGSKSPEVVPSLLLLASLYTQQEPTQEALLSRAEELLREAVEIRVATLGEEHPETGDAKLRLSMFFLQQDHLERAESLCRQAMMIFRHKLGMAHVLTGEAGHGLAVILREQGGYREAEEHFLEAKEVYIRAGGPESYPYLHLLADYAEALRAMGQDGEAREYEDYVTKTSQRVETQGPLLSFDLPSFEEGDASGLMFFVPRFREEM